MTSEQPDVSPRLRRSTLTAEVENALKADIIHGLWKPGDRIRTTDVSTRYGVSATPAREALQRLAALGFIEEQSQRGARIAGYSTKELLDLYEIRMLLEPVATKRAVESGDAAWLSTMTTSWSRLRSLPAKDPNEWAGRREAIAAWLDAHREFHAALLSACDSPHLLRIVQTMTSHSERFRMISRGLDTSRDLLAEHEQIYQAVMTRDAEAAADFVRHHLALTVDQLRTGGSRS